MRIGMVAGLLLSAVVYPTCAAVRAEEPKAKQSESQEYLLRYKFHPGDALRWTVVHRCRIRTSVSASTQTAETTTTSVKVWRVHEVKPDGSIVFDHMVESVDMRHRLSGRDEVHYNSRTDLCPPHGFEDVARAVGVPLAVVTIDSQGKVLERRQNFVKAAVAGQGEITVQLPEQAVAVGSRWSSLNNIEVPLPNGGRAADPRHAELQVGEREDGRGHDLDVDPDHDAAHGPGHRGPGLAIRDFRQRAI